MTKPDPRMAIVARTSGIEEALRDGRHSVVMAEVVELLDEIARLERLRAEVADLRQMVKDALVEVTKWRGLAKEYGCPADEGVVRY